jgi:hypothetical protein
VVRGGVAKSDGVGKVGDGAFVGEGQSWSWSGCILICKDRKQTGSPWSASACAASSWARGAWGILVNRSTSGGPRGSKLDSLDRDLNEGVWCRSCNGSAKRDLHIGTF